MRRTESGELNKIENLVRRMPLICLHLQRILVNAEQRFGGISRNIREGHATYQKFKNLESDLEHCRQFFTSLLSFIEDREQTIKALMEELMALKGVSGELQTRFNLSWEKGMLEHHAQKIKDIIDQENGHLKLVKHLIDEFVSGFLAKFKKICETILSEPKAIPAELKQSEDEFLYYLRKLVGALHAFCKLISGVERLEHIEEANFGYLYGLIGERSLPPQVQKTKIIEQVEKLEKDYGS